MSEFIAFVVAGVLGTLQAAANPDRPDLTEVQLQALRAKNIFSPYRTKPFPPKTSTGGTKGPETTVSAAPARPKPPVVTGIVYDEASKGFQAIVEDKNEERLRRLPGPKFLKAGDEIVGVRIEAVEKDKVVVVLGDLKKEIAAGDALPDAEAPSSATPASAPPATVESKPVEPGAVNSVLEELKKKNKKKDRTYDEP